MRRGEVWWANFPEPVKSRPVVLLSRDAVYQRRTHFTIAPVTSSIRPILSHVRVGPDDGLSLPSAVNLDDIQTIDRRRLGRRIVQLSEERMREVDEAIRYALDLPEFAGSR